MYLIYLDESGNTGHNLKDQEQPLFALGALIVPEQEWQGLEDALKSLVLHYFPAKPTHVEIHAKDIRSGRSYYREIALQERLAFLRDCIGLVNARSLRLVCRTIEKKRFAGWIECSFPKGVCVNPHVVAFPLVARVLDDYLQAQGADARGILISDENREIVGDIKKTTDLLRLADGSLRLHRIIEQCFFVDSKTSLVLQLCDICTFYCRKMGELDTGHAAAPYDLEMIEGIRLALHEGPEAFHDTIEWVIAGQKKGAARGQNP